MQDKSDRRWICVLLCGCVLAGGGCVSSSAPRGWMPSPSEAQQQAFGGWVELTYKTGSVAGELIAMEADSVFILHGGGLEAFAGADVVEARLFAYYPGTEWLGLWTLLGTLSTASHGFFLVLSAPVWIIGGTISAASQSRQPVLTYPKQGWVGWQAYARFPQGLPPGLARASLDPKPER